jgi:hypothetical protein
MQMEKGDLWYTLLCVFNHLLPMLVIPRINGLQQPTTYFGTLGLFTG